METEKTYNQMAIDFYNIFKEKLIPRLKIIEKTRTGKKNLALFLLILFTVLSICFFILFLAFFLKTYTKFDFRMIEYLVLIPLSIFSIGIFCFNRIKKKFEEKIKCYTMDIICNAIGDISWDMSKYAYMPFDSLGIIPAYDKSTFDDEFLGTFKDVGFHVIECKFEKEYRYRKNNHYLTVFKGLVISFDLNKNNKSHTIIVPDTLLKFKLLSSLKRTELEDVVFEKKYDVYTDDEVEARYLITTSFMDRLNYLKTAYKAENVSVAFYEDKIYIALKKNADLFNLGNLFTPTTDFTQYKQLFDQMIAIYKLIDYFKLDQKIGL